MLSQLAIKFPKDYVDIITSSNGVVGNVGKNQLILLLIVELNEGYRVEEFAKGLVLFGSNGEGTAFAFDTKSNETNILSVPYIGMDMERNAYRCSVSIFTY